MSPLPDDRLVPSTDDLENPAFYILYCKLLKFFVISNSILYLSVFKSTSHPFKGLKHLNDFVAFYSQQQVLFRNK